MQFFIVATASLQDERGGLCVTCCIGCVVYWGMESNSQQERQQAHTYLDHLPDTQLSAVRVLLEVMLGPFSVALANAPIDDEPTTEEEERELEEARQWLKHNPGIPMEVILADYGLTMADFERMGQTPLASEINGAGD